MGQWASADLVFGIDLGTNESSKFHVNHDEDNEDADFYHDGDIANIYIEWCALQKGVSHPGDYNDRDSKKWQRYNNAAIEFQKKYPFDVISYGTDYRSGLRYMLVLDGTEQHGDQYSAIAIDTSIISNLNIKEAIDIFKQFSDEFKLDLPAPKWLMTASYG